MINEENKKIFKKVATRFLFAILFIIVGSIILKYEVEGEKNMPFELTKISIISTANGIPNEETLDRWNFTLIQNNDIYFNIEKNPKVKSDLYIKKVSLENIKVTAYPNYGSTYFYHPSKNAVDWYENIEECRIDNKLEYIGNTTSNIKELKIGNHGGIVGIRYSIEDLGVYISDEDEIKHDGFLLKSIGIEEDDLKSSIQFDLIIEVSSGVRYRARISKELPLTDVLEEGISKAEEVELKNIIFKRI